MTPALFFGGAAAVAAPIVIHFLARRRFRRIRWAAMDFLIDAQRRNRRRLRMEEWLLLALRCLAVLLIALMIARPFIRPAGAAALLGGSGRIERVFVLDDSLSMAYQTAEGVVFSRTKVAVRRLIESIRRDTPDDTVTILRMSDPTAPVESGTYLDDAQTEELLMRLDALNPTQRSIDPANVMEKVADALKRNSGITSAAVYIISDFQRHDWVRRDTNRSEPTTSPSSVPADKGDTTIMDPLTAWAGEDRGLRLVLINVGEEDAANTAITELQLTGGQLVAGTTGTVRVKVANHAAEPMEAAEIQMTIGNLAQPSKTLRGLAPHQSVLVDIEAEFVRAGSEALRVELPPDALPADNVRYGVVDVASAIRVLVVNGEPSVDGFDDEVMLLTTALRPEGELFSGNEIVVLEETDLGETILGNFHAVVLANVYSLAEPVIESLERYVRGGGGVLVFLGDQVDADLYNMSLYRGGEGMLPAELIEIVRATKPAHLTVVDRLHPAMRGLSVEGDPLGLGQIVFREYFECVPFDPRSAESDREEGAGGETVGVGRGARVIARFDDAEEHPAIVERSFGRGRVILVATSADKEWHQWPDHPTFLPVMMELVRHVARKSDSALPAWVGQPIEMPLDPAVFEADAVVRTPALQAAVNKYCGYSRRSRFDYRSRGPAICCVHIVKTVYGYPDGT